MLTGRQAAVFFTPTTTCRRSSSGVIGLCGRGWLCVRRFLLARLDREMVADGAAGNPCYMEGVALASRAGATFGTIEREMDFPGRR
jgi:hypothetical protein